MIADVGVVGAGIVGLASARALLLRNPQLKLIVYITSFLRFVPLFFCLI
jgi:glycine/D-amino acid oxidase-like deaminating enzyme